MFFDAGGRGKGMNERRTPQGGAKIVLEFLNTGTSARVVPQAQHFTGHVPKLEGRIRGVRETGAGDPAGVYLEARARTELMHGVFPRNAQAGACMAP